MMLSLKNIFSISYAIVLITSVTLCHATLASQSFNQPYGVLVDREENVYIADTQNNQVKKIDLSGHLSTIAGTGVRGFAGDNGKATNAMLKSPSNLSIDSHGNLYIADFGSHRIRKIDTSGNISTVAGNGSQAFSGDGGPAIAASLSKPFGVFVDDKDNLYIADMGNNRIRKVDATSQLISTVAGNGVAAQYTGDGGPAIMASLWNPTGILVDKAHNLLIADFGNNCVRKVDATSNVISTVAGNGFSGFGGDGGPAIDAALHYPAGISIDQSGNLYIADTYDNRIRRVDALTGKISTVAGTGSFGFNGDDILASIAMLNAPFGIAFDKMDNLYIADTDNSRIRKVSLSTKIITTLVAN